jgi:hypothetical protein
MKSIYYLFTGLATIVFTFILTRFGHFAIDGTSVWGGGLWLLPVIITYGLFTFGLQTYLEVKAGGWSGWVYKNNVPAWHIDTDKVRFWQASYFWFTVACLVAEIVVVIAVFGDR